MRKIPTLFERDPEHRANVTQQVNPAAGWVLEGEGVATRKYDGTACLVEDGLLWKRYMVKHARTMPASFRPTGDPDPITGKQPGWVPVGDGPDDRWHREAKWFAGNFIPDGTYELIGPKIQGNPEGYDHHELLPHGATQIAIPASALNFVSLRALILHLPYEGIVWHHPDGRMAKLKRQDFAA